MPEERRLVTILFSDVTGSTALADAADPEDLRALLGRYYAIAREVVGAHGGTVEKFIGDAVMAVFGIPQAHGDDAERALAAALALREAVARDPRTSPLALRIGVNTGEVIAASREASLGDFLVTGDAVNVAARLQQHAEPGSILVGERTRRAVAGFVFGEPQELPVKGKRDPVASSVLLGRAAAARASTGPFLGRANDLAQLELVARRAFDERRPQLVTVTAPAGTGKSRLVEEFVRRTPPGVSVATAQCLPYGAAVTFVPLRGLVRDLLRLGPDQDPVAGLGAAFLAGGLGGDDAQRLASIIGVTLGDTAESERRNPEEVFTAWRLFLEVLAARGPLVVVFEDLHWASDTLLDLVEHVTLSRTAIPLVMFALARPEFLDRKPTWGGGRRNFTSLGLEPLDGAQTRQLVTALTAAMPEAIAAHIAERSGGNPFFAGELVRAYDQRRAEGQADADIRLPDTVHATVLARIDALPARERLVLEYAAVAGRTARAAAIRVLLPDLSRRDVEEALDLLVQRELLVPQGADACTFRHIVIREVAYATLPRAARVRAHVRLAQWLEVAEASGAPGLAELVAYHYRQALALSPGGRPPEDLPAEKVVSALERSARGASIAGAYREAGEQLRAALQLAAPSEHLRFLELLGDLMLIGDDAIAGYAEAYQRWRDLPDKDPRAGARLLAKRLLVAGRWTGSLTRQMAREEFLAHAAEARRLLALAPDELIADKLACACAFDFRRDARLDPAVFDEVRAGAELAARNAARRGDVEGESEALDAVGAVFRDGADFARAHQVSADRIRNADRLSLLERVDAWSVMAWDLVFLDRFDDAVDSYAEARRRLRPGEPEYMLGHGAAWAGYAAMLCGRWDEALVLADALLGMREEDNSTIGRFTLPGWLGAIRVAAARQDGTRLARYRSALASIGNLETLAEPERSLWSAFIHRDAQAARRALLAEHPPLPLDRRGELLAMLSLEMDEVLADEELAALERGGDRRPAVLGLRLRLARALAGTPAALREAVTALERGGLVADSARAAALLALRSGEASDRAEAERRLRTLGDLAYLQRLRQPDG